MISGIFKSFFPAFHLWLYMPYSSFCRIMKKKILMGIAAVATVFASVISTSACYFSFYQPEEPECLREE